MSNDNNDAKVIKWGIIGIGDHVKQRIAPAMNLAADTILAAVCSRSIERARSFAAGFGVERSFTSYSEMINESDIDAIYVSSPNNLHAEHTILAAKAGKHVLCEKPMAINEDDCHNMIEQCQSNKVKLGVAFQLRYHPAHQEARRLIECGDVGEIFIVKAQYCHTMLGHVLRQGGWRSDPSMAGAGALVSVGVHAVDLLRFLLGSEIKEVRALCEPKVADNIEEMVHAIFTFDNGAYGTVISGALAPRSDNDVVLYGSRAKIVCSGTVAMPLEGKIIIEGDRLNANIRYSHEHPMPANYITMIEAFNTSINENREPDIPGYDGLQMFRIADAILTSGNTGKAVKL